MLKNYITIALRHLLRDKRYAIINMFGLAIGLACTTVILLFVFHEWQTDKYHTQTNQIYRVIQETHTGSGKPVYSAGTSGLLGPTLAQDFPQVEQSVRLWRKYASLQHNDKMFSLTACFADPSIFNVFTFPLINGTTPATPQAPDAIFLTQDTAQRFFGTEDPIGKTLSLGTAFGNTSHHAEYRIAGILKNIPNGSSITFDCLITTQAPIIRTFWEKWYIELTGHEIETFIKVPQKQHATAIQTKLDDFVVRHLGKEVKITYHLQPFNQIYLHSQTDYALYSEGNIYQIYLFLTVALFILGIACINFINISTARAETRSREVGLRKVVGANRSQLIQQFLGESILFACLSGIMAIGLVDLILPTFNTYVARTLAFPLSALPFVLLFAIVVGILAGIYPAYFLSAFQAASTLKGISKTSPQGQWFRQGLVVFQFAISTLLIIGTLVVNQQMDFIKNKSLGFKAEQLIMIPIFGVAPTLNTRQTTIKQEFLKHPNVLSATVSRYQMGPWDSGGKFKTVKPEGTHSQKWMMRVNEVDADYLQTFQIEQISGRNITAQDLQTNTPNAFLLNETAVKELGWENPIGKTFELVEGEGYQGVVVGVIKDYHSASLHEKIAPMAIMSLNKPNLLTLRIHPKNLTQTMAFLENTYNRFLPDASPFITFLDEDMASLYEQEKRQAQLTAIFSTLAIFIACMGLFGLVTFTVARRTKEIGIRKVLGASTFNIMSNLSTTLLKMVVLSNLIAYPIAFYLAQQWLQNFAYRISPNITLWLTGSFIALFIALFTISFQTYKAAISNPIDTLRNDG